jgi:phosphatidylglycerol:prolipoprotein diacylglycerol transferase
MWPYVVEWGWFKIGTYGVMMAVGFLTASWLLARDLKRRNMSPAIADTIVLLGIVGGVLGAKLAYMWTEARSFEWGDLLSGNGLTWHGGLISLPP